MSNIDLPTLLSLPTDAVYCRLPLRAAERCASNAPWDEIQASMEVAAAEQKTWESMQWVGLLFDTYGDVIDEVGIDLSPDEDSSSERTYHYVTINGEALDSTGQGLDADTMETINNIDDGHIFYRAITELHNIVPAHLCKQLHVVSEAVNNTYYSRQQALDISRTQSGWIGGLAESLLEERRLEQNTAKTHGSARSPGRI